MNRLPNPPKVPCISAAETRAKAGFKLRAAVQACLVVATTMAIGMRVSADETAAVRSLLRADACQDACCTGGQDRPAHNVIVFGTDAVRGRTIRDHAEAMRREAFATLLGEAEPRPWVAACEIHVHATAEAFAAAVGGPPVDARGATSLDFLGDTAVSRRIDVMGDGPDVIPDSLDHELVHVVLADHFVHAPPPRWADEGLALLFDSPEKQRAHQSDFHDAIRRGLALSPADLVSLEEYPDDGGRQRIFYGQSAALVRWLVARRDAATFIRFIDDSAAIGIEAALQRHYALDSLVSVTSAWKEVAPINSLGLADLRRERLP